MVAQLSSVENFDQQLIKEFEVAKQIVAGVRQIRLERNIANKESLMLNITQGSHNGEFNAVISKMCNLSEIVTATKDATSAVFMVGTTEYAVPLLSKINIEEEIAKLEKAWELEKDAIEGAYKALKAVDEAAAKEYLTQYTCAQAQKSWDWAHYMISKLGEARIMDNCKVWNDGNEFGE